MPPSGSVIEIGHGISNEREAFVAGNGAAAQAMSAIQNLPVASVIVYVSGAYDLTELLRGVRQAVGDSPVFGTTTAGEIHGGLHRGGVVVCVLASTYLTVRCAVGRGVAQDWRQATEAAMADPAVRPYFDADPDGQWCRTRDGKAVFAMLFSPGNRRGADSKSYEITEFIKARTLSLMPIIGGASADDWRMEGNSVLLGGVAWPDGLLLVVFETQLQCGLALGHGFQPTMIKAVVTAADDHEVLTLDGRSAAEVFGDLLGQEHGQLNGQHITLTTGKMVGTADPMGQYSINVASFYTERGGVRFTQPLAVGTTVTMMAADTQTMVVAGREVIRKALLRGGIVRPAVALVAYCALRPRIIGEDAVTRELDGMVELLGDAPLLGFCSFGEQGMADDGVSRHNNGAVSALVIGDSLSQTALVAIENQRLRAQMDDKAKELEAAHLKLHQAYGDLEHRVSERTAALVGEMEERKQAELALLGSEKKFRQAMRFAPIGEALVSPDGRWLEVNPALCRIVGYSEKELLARDFQSITHPDDLDTDLAYVSQLLTGELETYQMEKRYFHKTGGIIWVQLNVTLVRNDDDKPAYFISQIQDITERKALQHEVSEKNCELNTILDNSSVGITFVRERRQVWANRKMAELFGYEFGEMTNIKTRMFFASDDDYKSFGREAYGALARGGQYTAERRMLHRDGRRIWMRMSGKAIDPVRATAGSIWIFEDISERIRIESDLRKSDELAKTLMNASSDAAFLLDRNGIILAGNEAFSDRFRQHGHNLVGLSFFDLISPDIARTRRADCHKVMATGVPIHSQDERAGLILDNRIYPVLGADGSVSGVAVFSRDITERQKAEREIRLLLAKQRAVLSNTPIGISIISYDRLILEANPAFHRAFGYEDGALIGLSTRVLYGSDSQYEELGRRSYPYLMRGESFCDDVAMSHANGSQVWMRLVAHAVDTNAPELGVIWALEDITGRKQLELDLRRSNEELERFAYVASHDMRQPLRMVSSYLGLLERRMKGRIKEEEQEFLDFAVNGAKRLDAMIVDLLDYSRIGRQGPEPEAVALDNVLVHALENLEAAIADAGAKVSVSTGLPSIVGYDSELVRLFQNLIGNAIKFQAPGRAPRVTVECRETTWEWVIAIADNGIGIAPEDHHRLFAVFQRLVGQQQYEGTGIGLAACRKIAEHHGGRIWVESSGGDGSTFFVTVPKFMNVV